MANAKGLARRIPLPRRDWYRRWFHDSAHAVVPLAVAVGAITSLCAIGFLELITFSTRLFTGYDTYSGLGRVASLHFPGLGFWFLLLAPVIAGAIYGPLLHRYAPEARGHGVPEVMYAVSHNGGRISPRVTVVKTFASALCIGGGGSVGLIGPIIQICSAAGSGLAQLLRTDTQLIRLLVACGAAGGISATFNAPLAGAFLAIEVVLRDFTARSFGAIMISSVTADVIGRAMLGDQRFFSFPSFVVHSHHEYLLFAVLGIAVGAVGVAFSKMLFLMEDVCGWVWRGPDWARPAVGGIALGALLIALPEMYGVGYPVLENAVLGEYALPMLLLLMVGKMFATSLTIGIGGSGGVFAPTLFIGAMAGTAFGVAAHDLFPTVTGSAGGYGLIGMAAALAGSAGAPITAVLILFELTGQYSFILPLMTAVVMAAGTGRLLSKETIYTTSLWRRGVDLDHPPDQSPAFRAADVATSAPDPLVEDMSLGTASEVMSASHLGMLPVVDTDGTYQGCVSAADLVERMVGNCAQQRVREIVRRPVTIDEDAAPEEILAALSGYGGTGLPVLDRKRTAVIGWITYENVLGRMHPDISKKTAADP